MARGTRKRTGAVARARTRDTAQEPSPGAPLLGAQQPGPFKELLAYRFITTPEEVADVAARFATAGEISLDIETAVARGYGAWRGAMRLMQLGVDSPDLGREQAVIDCFAVDPAPLFDLLRDPERVITIHNAPFEQEWLAYHHDVWMPNVYDTCAAWKLIHKTRGQREEGYGRRSAGLAAVCDELFSATMPKDEQSSAWGRPALSVSQIEYAALDAAILHPVAEKTRAIAEELQIADKIASANGKLEKRIKTTIGRHHRTRDRKDETQLMGLAIRQSLTVEELDRAWRAARQIPLQHRNRERLHALYAERRAELAGEPVAA